VEVSLYDSLRPVSETRNEIYDAVALGKYAYLAVEDVGIQILDMSNPAQPTLAGVYNVEGEIEDISIADNIVYVATDSDQLQVVDVGDPSLPIKIGAYDSSGSITRLEVANNHIYAAAGSDGLHVIDTINPKLPVEVGHFMLPDGIRKMAENYDEIGYVTGLTIKDDLAYLAVKDIGIQAVDISNPHIPLAANFYFLTHGINDVAVNNGQVYVSKGFNGVEVTDDPPAPLAEINYYKVSADFPYSFKDVAIGEEYFYILSDNGLMTAELSENNTFTEVDFYELDFYYLNDLATDGRYVYIASEGMQIIEISESGIPIRETHAILEDSILTDIVVDGNYAYVSAFDGLWVVNISDPLKPVVESHFASERRSFGLEKEGDNIYLGFENDGIWIFDVSNPDVPLKIGSYIPPKTIRHFTISGNYLYVGVRTEGLHIVNVANPFSPVEISFLDLYSVEKISIVDDYAYISISQGVLIADISNPYEPREINRDFYSDFAWRKIMAASNDYVYLYGYDGNNWNIWKVNIKTPGYLGKIYHDESMFETVGVDAQGDYAYIVTGTSGLRIVDISSPMIPAEVGSYDEVALRLRDVAVNGNFAYVTNLEFYGADIENDLTVIDVSNPRKPVKLKSYDLPGVAFGVAVDDEYIYIAAGTNGIYIFRLKSPL
jgi:hypothetical protein